MLNSSGLFDDKIKKNFQEISTVNKTESVNVIFKYIHFVITVHAVEGFAMDNKQDLLNIIKTKDDQIKTLQQQLVAKDEEIEQLRSQLDKFQSVLPKALVQPRKVRAQGISAEPQTARSIQDYVTNNSLKKHQKSNR